MRILGGQEKDTRHETTKRTDAVSRSDSYHGKLGNAMVYPRFGFDIFRYNWFDVYIFFDYLVYRLTGRDWNAPGGV